MRKKRTLRRCLCSHGGAAAGPLCFNGASVPAAECFVPVVVPRGATTDVWFEGIQCKIVANAINLALLLAEHKKGSSLPAQAPVLPCRRES